jgi:hypothetical protein
MARIIGYDNVLRRSDASFSSVEQLTANPLQCSLDGKLFTAWKPPASPGRYMRFTVDFSASVSVDYLAIAGHNIGSASELVILEWWNGSAWVSVLSFTPTPEAVAVRSFASASSSKWRFTVDAGSGHTIDPALRISVLNFGAALAMPRLMAPLSPPGIAQGRDNINNISHGGKFIGASSYYAPFDVVFDFKLLTPEWVRDYVPNFIESSRDFPFFVAWDTVNYASEVAYCWTHEDARPPTYTTIQFMSWMLKARGIKYT